MEQRKMPWHREKHSHELLPRAVVQIIYLATLSSPLFGMARLEN